MKVPLISDQSVKEYFFNHLTAQTIEMVNGGDAKFNKIGDELPDLTVF